MEIAVLKRDQENIERRHDFLLGPENEQNHLKLERYQVTEEELRATRKWLAHPNCIVDSLSIIAVTFNDKKAKLLSQAISANDSINRLVIKKCKIRQNHMELISQAIGKNESISDIWFEKCNLLQKHGTALGQALIQNVSLKHLTLNGVGIGDLAMIEIAKGIKEAICLEHVDLRHNNFEQKGFKALVDGLKETMACKVLQLEGFHIKMDEAKMLGEFFSKPDCLLVELNLHQAEIDYDEMEYICMALKSCSDFKAISFSKNNLGVDDFNETSTSEIMDESMEQSIHQESQSGRSVNRNMQLSIHANEVCMMNLVTELTYFKYQMDRLCLAHCYFHDRGMRILADKLKATQIRYLNISWCRITAASVQDLCRFLKTNHKLEKAMIQHNEIGDVSSMKLIATAISDHPNLKYIDISANNVQSESFVHILTLQSKDKIKLANFQCRKNKIEGDKIYGIFKKLKLNTNLRVLNLQDNFIDNANAEEIRDHYVKQNIFIEQVVFKGNKSLHSSIEENIDDECRKNLLIQKHILPMLPKSDQTGYLRGKKVEKTCCGQYDVRKLFLEDVQYYTVDFISKFCEIHNKELHNLTLKNVHSQKQLLHLMSFLLAEKKPIFLQTLHIENSPIQNIYSQQIIKSLRTNTTIKYLYLVNQMSMQRLLRLLYHNLKDNTTLEYLSLANNEIDNYKHINKLIKKNHTLHSLDITGNYMNEDILEELWESLHENINLVNLQYDSQDKVLEEEAIESVHMELENNELIQDCIVEHLAENNPRGFKGEYDFSGGLCFTRYASLPAALIKYLHHYIEDTKKVSFRDSDIQKEVLLRLAYELSERKIIIEELNLSNLQVIDDESVEQISNLLFMQLHNGSSSSVSTIILDDNNISNEGLNHIIQNASQNSTLRKISLRNCKVDYATITTTTTTTTTTPPQSDFTESVFISALKKNCGIIEIDLHGNLIPESLEQLIKDELEMNQGIVENIFPAIKDQELKYLKKQVHDMRKKAREQVKLNQLDTITSGGSFTERQFKRGPSALSKKFTGTLNAKNSEIKTEMTKLRKPLTSTKTMMVSKHRKKGSITFGGEVDMNSLNGDSRDSQSQKNQYSSILKNTERRDKTSQRGGFARNQDPQSIEQSSWVEDIDSDSSNSMAIQSEYSQTSKRDNSVGTFDQSQFGLGAMRLSLEGKSLKHLDFLTKFVREFPRIQHIDLNNNAISNIEMEKFMQTVEGNHHIQNINIEGNKIGGQLKKTMQKELQKNNEINKLMNAGIVDTTVGQTGGQTINLKNKQFKDISVLSKLMLTQDFTKIQVLNMSNNNLDDAGALQLADLLEEKDTIEKLDISGNKLTQVGLQIICSALASDKSKIKELDISKNNIPDANLKMLMGMLYENDKITEIKYTLNNQANKDRYNQFHEKLKIFESQQKKQNEIRLKQIKDLENSQVLRQSTKDFKVDSLQAALNLDKFVDEELDDHHALELKCWHYVIFPVWIWKTFIHAKHEAFHFKYDPDSIKCVEQEQMKNIGRAMYILTFIYFGTMFGIPFQFVTRECGAGFDSWVYFFYGGQAILTLIYEIVTVKLMERRLHKKEVFEFNRWHFVEAIMGQVARLDTFLDACFLVLLIQCEMWNLVIPVSIFIAIMVSYPMSQIFILCRVKKTLSHTQPYMERNCQLAFIRENMLIATVLDSFCIDNTVTLFKKPIAFGRLMGAYTFFCQDFPQLSIHLYFLIFMHDPASLILHAHPLVLIGLVTSCFAIMISTFNWVMFKQNMFDPLIIEKEIYKRKQFRKRLAGTSAQPNEIAPDSQIQENSSQLTGFKRKIIMPNTDRKITKLPTIEELVDNQNSPNSTPARTSIKKPTFNINVKPLEFSGSQDNKKDDSFFYKTNNVMKQVEDEDLQQMDTERGLLEPGKRLSTFGQNFQKKQTAAKNPAIKDDNKLDVDDINVRFTEKSEQGQNNIPLLKKKK